MHRFIGNIGILLVARALVVLRSVRLPVADAHPAEIVFAIEALHVIAAAVLLNADVTARTVFGVCTDVVGRFTVIGALGQPASDHPAIGGRMIISAALIAKRCATCTARGFLRCGVR